MNLSTKLRLQKTKILKTGQFYNIILEHKNYRINEPDQFLENSKINFFAFLDKENNLHHFNRLCSNQMAKTNLSELLQIPSIRKIEVFELSSLSEQEVNSISLSGLDAITQEQIQILKKLLEAFTGMERNAVKGKEVEFEKYLTENMSDYIDSQDLVV